MRAHITSRDFGRKLLVISVSSKLPQHFRGFLGGEIG